MSRPSLVRRPADLRHVGDWFERIAGVVMVTVIGVALGVLYMKPEKRSLSTIGAVIVTGIAWRLDFVSGVGLLIMALPYPKATTFGSTTLALIMLLAIIYLLRVSQREVPTPRSTPLDAPILALVGAYVISFYNVVNLPMAFSMFMLFVGTLILYYLVVNSIRSEEDLRKLHMLQSFTTLGILLLALYELNHPGASIIPGWIELGATERTEEFNRSNIRIGSSFGDYELLADFCGLNLLFFAFQIARARGPYRRAFFGGMMGLSLLVLFCTVTRGPIFSLSAALLYLAWMTRRHLRVVPVSLGLAAVAVSFVSMNFFVSHFTSSGDLFARLGGTKLQGVLPEDRAGIWAEAFQRWMIHPIIGWGPYYSHEHGLVQWYWPHNLYLYVANIVGVVGLTFFLVLLYRLWRLTRPSVDTLGAPSYVDSYLLIARTQLAFFLADQTKIDYLRNWIYQYQVWLMFGFWVAAERLARESRRPQGHPVRLAEPPPTAYS